MNEVLMSLLKTWTSGNERCGVVLEGGEVVELTNQAENPRLAFAIPDQDLEPYRDRVVASWHTHPRTTGNLSVADYRLFQAHPAWQHYIVDQTRVWQYSVAFDGMVMLDATFSLPVNTPPEEQ